MIALLRGINVGGKSLKMELVRTSFEAMGFKGVRTYVQSGNVYFATKAHGAALAAKIEAKLRDVSGLDVSVIVRTESEIAAVLAKNPFLKESGIDPTRLYVTFLDQKPTKAALAKLAAVEFGTDDRYAHVGTEIYLHCPKSYGGTKLSNNAIEKALGVVATTRNWKTVNELNRMAAE